ncbi:SpaH/EbpB family LPXTG-anchored major pilin [Slackia piriformis]|uniref:SpaH/EbpB family LPXTG-anchored major pilin n=1 Tax=Slackia piriformis TaxID=626934 RepID=UPI0026DD1949|nr:SpaH/EbpB family LPXTG-anchored major pilin [Slackia piriformis]MDO5024094.1 SpaH/EbpB family LPXTG-anchored major pilin [Slackia piriformis]
MQATARKAVALFVAAMMALAMAFVIAPSKAFAATTGNLTITNQSAEFEGKQVKAWQMFSATVTADGKNASYTLNAEWDPFFTTEIGGNMTGLSGEDLSQAAIEYVNALGTDEGTDVIAFAKKAADWAKKQGIGATSTVTAAASGDAYVAKFEGLAFGYYVVSPQSGSTADRGTDAILANVVTAEKDVNLKSEYPTISKTVDGSNHADAQVGDVLNFELKSKVPNMDEYTTYVFNFVDTLSKGLTLDQNTIKVTIGDLELQKDVDYTVSATGGAGDATELKIIMTDFKTKHGDKAGQEIKVTYSASINEHAVAGMDDAGNSAKLEYSNDPINGGTGESVPDVTHGYTFDFDITKTDGMDGSALAGAVFQLQKKGEGTPIKLIVKQQGDETQPAIVRPAKTDEMGQAVDTITTPKSGKITFEGLDAIAYQLVETEAPDGYNKLKDPVDVTIVANYDQDGVLQSWTVNGGGNDVALNIQNNKGTLLPETGGMGTIIFTVVGALAIIGGIAWAVRRKHSVR